MPRPREATHRAAVMFAAAAVLAALAAAPALAHGAGAAGGDIWPQILLTGWRADAWIVVPLILAAWVYGRGVAAAGKAEGDGGDVSGWHHAAFFAGLAVFYLVLQSPIEPISDRLFIVHQVEHMGLRTIGPLLLMLAAPQAALIRGLPRRLRGGALAPVAGNRVVQGVFGVLAHPVGATALFLGASTFWMLPAWHDAAILDTPVHYTWHATLMASGLIFFWRVFDPRPRPLGISLAARIAMLWFAVMGNVLLGAYLSFKTGVLYHAYDATGRLWGIAAASDERFGGLTMWIPGSMMFAMAMLAVVHRWRRHEERAEALARPRAGKGPIRAEAYLAGRRGGNRALAYGMAGFVAFVFACAILIAIAYDRGIGHA